MAKLPAIQLSATELALSVGERYEDSIINLAVGDPGTRKSLLFRDIHEWPTTGAKSELATLATNRQAYAAFLGFLANGVRVTTAARAVGILQRSVTEWLKKGSKHLSEGKGSVYAWFYLDCFQARGSSLVKAEMAAYQDDPLAFIKRMDAGGQFNDLEPAGAEVIFRLTESPINPDTDDDVICGDDIKAGFEFLAKKVRIDLDALSEEAVAQAGSSQSDEDD